MEFQPLLLRPLTNHIHQIIQEGAYGIFHGNNLHLARFNLGKVQNIIDQSQKGCACRTNVLGIFPRLFLLSFPQNHLVHAQHRIDGCADFMAHRGEKLTLGNAGGLGGMRHFQKLLIGVSQFLGHGIQKSRHAHSQRNDVMLFLGCHFLITFRQDFYRPFPEPHTDQRAV